MKTLDYYGHIAELVQQIAENKLIKGDEAAYLNALI